MVTTLFLLDIFNVSVGQRGMAGSVLVRACENCSEDQPLVEGTRSCTETAESPILIRWGKQR